MLNAIKLVSLLMAFSLVFAVPSFAGVDSPESSIASGKHRQLASHYAEQAADFKAKARFWDNTAESYEHHPELYSATDIADEAAHCRQIARNYRKMADEASQLAAEHLNMVRKGQ